MEIDTVLLLKLKCKELQLQHINHIKYTTAIHLILLLLWCYSDMDSLISSYSFTVSTTVQLSTSVWYRHCLDYTLSFLLGFERLEGAENMHLHLYDYDWTFDANTTFFIRMQTYPELENGVDQFYQYMLNYQHMLNVLQSTCPWYSLFIIKHNITD